MSDISKFEIDNKFNHVGLIGGIYSKLFNGGNRLLTDTGITISSPNADEPNVNIIGYSNITYNGISGLSLTITYDSNTKNYNVDIGTKQGAMHIRNLHQKSDIFENIENLYVKTYNFLLAYKFHTLSQLKSEQ